MMTQRQVAKPQVLDFLIPYTGRVAAVVITAQPCNQETKGRAKGGNAVGSGALEKQCSVRLTASGRRQFLQTKVLTDNCPLPGTQNWGTKMESLSLPQARPLPRLVGTGRRQPLDGFLRETWQQPVSRCALPNARLTHNSATGGTSVTARSSGSFPDHHPCASAEADNVKNCQGTKGAKRLGPQRCPRP